MLHFTGADKSCGQKGIAMLALDNMTLVSEEAKPETPVEEWSWTPQVRDLGSLNTKLIHASGDGRSTSKKTQMTGAIDHGEWE